MEIKIKEMTRAKKSKEKGEREIEIRIGEIGWKNARYIQNRQRLVDGKTMPIVRCGS